jgi:hypothetical protein
MAVPTSAPTAAADAFAAVSFEPSDILKEYGETPRFPLGDAASLLEAQLELAGREQGVVLQRSSDELVDAFVEGASLTVATTAPRGEFLAHLVEAAREPVATFADLCVPRDAQVVAGGVKVAGG